MDSRVIVENLVPIESSCHADAPLNNVRQSLSILDGSVFPNNIPCLALSYTQVGLLCVATAR